jgi:hypothetical protein
MSNKAVSFSIDMEIPESYVGNLLDFIYQKYLMPQQQRFANISRATVDGRSSLTFTTLDQSGTRVLDVTVKGGKPIDVSMTPLSENVPEEAITQVRQDLVISIESFEEKVR